MNLTNVSPNIARMVAKASDKMVGASACVMFLSLVQDVKTRLMASILVVTWVLVRMEDSVTLEATVNALMTILEHFATPSLVLRAIHVQVFSVIMEVFVLWTLSAWNHLVSVTANTLDSGVRTSTLAIVFMVAHSLMMKMENQDVFVSRAFMVTDVKSNLMMSPMQLNIQWIMLPLIPLQLLL